jgi:hypothetical protein
MNERAQNEIKASYLIHVHISYRLPLMRVRWNPERYQFFVWILAILNTEELLSFIVFLFVGIDW